MPERKALEVFYRDSYFPEGLALCVLSFLHGVHQKKQYRYLPQILGKSPACSFCRSKTNGYVSQGKGTYQGKSKTSRQSASISRPSAA